MFPLVDALNCQTLKTYCYENDFTLPKMSTLLTIILDVVRALTVPQLNLLCYLAPLQAQGILTQSLIGTYPHSSFSLCGNIHPDCSMSHRHLKQLSLLQRPSFILSNKAIRENQQSHKGRKYEPAFGRRYREMLLLRSLLSFIHLLYLMTLSQVGSAILPWQFSFSSHHHVPL